MKAQVAIEFLIAVLLVVVAVSLLMPNPERAEKTSLDKISAQQSAVVVSVLRSHFNYAEAGVRVAGDFVVVGEHGYPVVNREEDYEER